MSYQRRKIVHALVSRGFFVHREGGAHTIYRGRAGEQCPVPRHNDIKRPTARSIAKQARVPWSDFEREIS